jgi:predicted RNA binding protein YcfA (HicA-like mRNA interferase family)
MSSNPNDLRHDGVVRQLRRAGWEVAREGHRHTILTTESRPMVTLTVPRHGARDINKFTVLGIIADAGLSVEQYNGL